MLDASQTASSTSAYISDVPYTLGFYRVLAPSFLDYVCLINGVRGLPSGRRLRYCELGCGRGYATALLAAANPDIDFVGIDFNPAHIEEAAAFAERAALDNVEFLDIDFAAAARSDDATLGGFDIVALHGVYAWVPVDVREAIHEFLGRKLVSGGIAFVSYNAMPGWARLSPTQRLLFEVAQRTPGDSIERIEAGVSLLRELLQNSEGLVERTGLLTQKYLDHLSLRDRHYLAHEFLSAAWQPMFVTEVMAAMNEVNLDYAGSCNIPENRIEFCVPNGLRARVRAAPDVGMRELLKDYIFNKPFRRDIYVKKQEMYSPKEKRDRLLKQRFVILPPVKDFPDTLRVPAAALKPPRNVLSAIRECMERGSASGQDLLIASIKADEHKEERVWALVEALVDGGLIHPVRNDAPECDHAPSHRINRVVQDLSVVNNTHGYLASPVLGSAIAANLPERILAPILLADPGLSEIAAADMAFDKVNGANQDFIRDGKPVPRNEDNVKALAGFVREFREHRLPRWRTLGIIQ